MKPASLVLIGGLSALLATSACEDKQSDVTLAPESTGLKETKPAAKGAEKLAIETQGSKVDFMMEAPVEKIRGKVHDAANGEINVDLSDVTKTTAKITVDISGIELFQRKANDKGEFGEEKKEKAQNEHAREWLEIGPSAPEDKRELYERVELVVKKIDGCSATDISKMSGNERKVTCTVTGDFLLHGRTNEKTAEVEVTFTYAGDKPTAMTFKTVKPFGINLGEHDVHPRTAFGKLAESTLETLAPKVAKEALVSIELTAKAGAGGTEPAKAAPSAP